MKKEYIAPSLKVETYEIMSSFLDGSPMTIRTNRADRMTGNAQRAEGRERYNGDDLFESEEEWGDMW